MTKFKLGLAAAAAAALAFADELEEQRAAVAIGTAIRDFFKAAVADTGSEVENG